MTITLAEEIALLSLDDESGEAKERQAAAWAVAGGILLELAFAGRVSVSGGRIAVTDEDPTGEPLLDERLALITAWAAKRQRAPKVTEWLTKDQAKAPAATVARLCERGLVVEEKHRVLGLFPVRRYPEADGSAERELRERLRAVVLDGAAPDERTAGLVALVHGAKLHRLAFPGEPRKEIAARMAELAEGQWATDGVREAIRDMQAAVTTATVVTLFAATS
ncbi:GPP34 family phosphoprotein [Streptomyces roseofulvus]|uniref:GPP34 family phosphoprotein n=2 Tax=Streptomyces TaxID=1883 RepID=A0ABU4KDI8_9ACTN|nr:GPP34 family phosphoprotein [Streptomyces roseolus]MDX2295838.1 GPP34 family phosphoprotein [Streptomyces roseolus]